MAIYAKNPSGFVKKIGCKDEHHRYTMPDDIKEKCIEYFILDDGSWDCVSFPHYLSARTLVPIATIRVTANDNRDAFVACSKGPRGGVFTVKTAYDLRDNRDAFVACSKGPRGGVFSVKTTYNFVKKIGRKDDHHNGYTVSKMGVRGREIRVRWEKPREGWKLNVDGCAKGSPGRAGGGGLFRNRAGKWVTGFTCNFGITTSIKSEMATLLIGLQVARDMNIDHLTVETDSQIAVNLLKNPISKNSPFGSWIAVCKSILQQKSGFQVVHIYREANRCADWLASFGLKQPLGAHNMNEAPPALLTLLESDERGDEFPRIVPS